MKDKKIIIILIIQLVVFTSVIFISSRIMVKNNLSWGMLGMSDKERLAFNKKFEQYGGNEVRGSVVQDLMTQIIAINMEDTEIGVSVEFDDRDYGFKPSNIKIIPSKIYTVTFVYSRGIIDKVIIKTNNVAQ